MAGGVTAPAKMQEIGGILEDFRLPESGAGESLSLSGMLTGKRGAVVMFWSGVCSHCVRYDEYFNGFAEKYPDIALVVVASRHGETAEMVRASKAERGLKFPILMDAGSALARAWFTQQTPRVFLVDADRKLLYRGAIDNFKYRVDPQFEGYLDRALEAFRAGKPVERTETASFGCAIYSVYYILPKAL
jgi:thiol-disulfide isomerase/thioredoxin